MGGGYDNNGVGFDDGACDVVCCGRCVGTDECGADEAVVGLVEGINFGCVEGYSMVESGG